MRLITTLLLPLTWAVISRQQEELLREINKLRDAYPSSKDEIDGRPKNITYNSDIAVNEDLSAKAQTYAEVCAKENMGGHTADGRNPQQRYAPTSAGEAVAMATTYDMNMAMNLLKDEGQANRDHYKILLTPGVKSVGVGVHNANGNWCWVVAVPT